LYSFDEFWKIIEVKNIRLKNFFDELYYLFNLFFKNKNLQAQVKKQPLFVCYFLYGIWNKFINDVKRDLTIYLDFTSTFNISIDIFTDLSIIILSLIMASQPIGCELDCRFIVANIVDFKRTIFATSAIHNYLQCCNCSAM